MKKLHISFVVLTVLSVCIWTGALRLLFGQLYELQLPTSVIDWIGTAIYVLMTVMFLIVGSVGHKLTKEQKDSGGKKTVVIISNIIMLLHIICSLYISASSVITSIMGIGNGAAAALVVSLVAYVPPVVPYAVYLIVAYLNKRELMMSEDELMVKRSGTVMVVLGWIFSVIGAVGSVISKIVYNNAEEDYEDRLYSFYTDGTSDMEIAQIALYICLGLLVLGVIFLVAGYVSRSQKQSDIRTEKIMQQLVNNNQNNIAPAVNIPVYTEEKTGVSCPNCGYKNTEGAKFCNSCGQKLVSGKTCSACGFENSATAKFCKNCGNKFAAEEEE